MGLFGFRSSRKKAAKKAEEARQAEIDRIAAEEAKRASEEDIEARAAADPAEDTIETTEPEIPDESDSDEKDTAFHKLLRQVVRANTIYTVIGSEPDFPGEVYFTKQQTLFARVHLLTIKAITEARLRNTGALREADSAFEDAEAALDEMAYRIKEFDAVVDHDEELIDRFNWIIDNTLDAINAGRFGCAEAARRIDEAIFGIEMDYTRILETERAVIRAMEDVRAKLLSLRIKESSYAGIDLRIRQADANFREMEDLLRKVRREIEESISDIEKKTAGTDEIPDEDDALPADPAVEEELLRRIREEGLHPFECETVEECVARMRRDAAEAVEERHILSFHEDEFPPFDPEEEIPLSFHEDDFPEPEPETEEERITRMERDAAEAELHAEEIIRAASRTRPAAPGGVHKATELIRETFEQKELHHVRVEIRDNVSYVRVGMSGENAPGKDFYFFSEDERNDVCIKSEPIVHIPKDRLPRMYRAVNELNRRFRYPRFYISEDGDLLMQGDIAQDTGDASVGPVAFEYLIRMISILDDAYPDIMKALWG